MEFEFLKEANRIWDKYFTGREKPVGVFYSDNLSDEIYPSKPLANSRGYTCLFAQLAKLHNGTPLAFDIENLGCFGSILNIFGGLYNEEGHAGFSWISNDSKQITNLPTNSEK